MTITKQRATRIQPSRAAPAFPVLIQLPEVLLDERLDVVDEAGADEPARRAATAEPLTVAQEESAAAADQPVPPAATQSDQPDLPSTSDDKSSPLAPLIQWWNGGGGRIVFGALLVSALLIAAALVQRNSNQRSVNEQPPADNSLQLYRVQHPPQWPPADDESSEKSDKPSGAPALDPPGTWTTVTPSTGAYPDTGKQALDFFQRAQSESTPLPTESGIRNADGRNHEQSGQSLH